MAQFNLPLTVKLIHEPEAKSAPYVAFTPELDLGSQGKTPEEAKESLREAVEAFLEVVAEVGTLEEVLEEAGFSLKKDRVMKRKYPRFEKISIPLHMLNASHYSNQLQKSH